MGMEQIVTRLPVSLNRPALHLDVLNSRNVDNRGNEYWLGFACSVEILDVLVCWTDVSTLNTPKT